MYNQGFDPFNIIRGCRGWEGIAGLRAEDASWAISGGCEVDDPVAMRKSKQADWSSWQIRGIISFIHGIHSLQGHIHVLTMAKINARRYQHYPPYIRILSQHWLPPWDNIHHKQEEQQCLHHVLCYFTWIPIWILEISHLYLSEI